MKKFLKKIPQLRSLVRYVKFKYIAPLSFPGSADYWQQRYQSGGTSGAGSYNELAEFKAEVLNAFVKENGVRAVIEYGCGDGNQLRLSNYPSYLGFDISEGAIARCKEIFSADGTKSFKTMGEYAGETAELTLSLDVIYHLIEDHVYYTYMDQLFDSSTRYVILYSSNTDNQDRFQVPHVRHRRFSSWIEQNKAGWELVRYIPNRYPYTGDEKVSSFADFYIYEKTL